MKGWTEELKGETEDLRVKLKNPSLLTVNSNNFLQLSASPFSEDSILKNN